MPAHAHVVCICVHNVGRGQGWFLVNSCGWFLLSCPRHGAGPQPPRVLLPIWTIPNSRPAHRLGKQTDVNEVREGKRDHGQVEQTCTVCWPQTRPEVFLPTTYLLREFGCCTTGGGRGGLTTCLLHLESEGKGWERGGEREEWGGDRERDRQTGRERGRERGRQTHAHTHTHTHRERERERERSREREPGRK